MTWSNLPSPDHIDYDFLYLEDALGEISRNTKARRRASSSSIWDSFAVIGRPPFIVGRLGVAEVVRNSADYRREGVLGDKVSSIAIKGTENRLDQGRNSC